MLWTTALSAFNLTASDDQLARPCRIVASQGDVESLAPQSVLQSANSVLHFALELISLAVAFELAVAGYLSNDFLHFALGLLGRALDAIFGLQYLNTVGM